MKKLLVEINFRLRNIKEYNEIKQKFVNNGYEVLNIENFNHREFSEVFLLNYFKENQLKEKYEKIAVISNIEDAIFVWHRLYNFLADDFIFFVDKYNYRLFKGKIYETLALMKSIEKEKIDEIYINSLSEYIEKIIINPQKIKYIKIIKELDLEKKKLKKEESKSYILGEEKIEYIAKNIGIKRINLEEEQRTLGIYELADLLEKNTNIMILYMVMSYKSANADIEKIIKINTIFKMCFDYIRKNSNIKEVLEKIFYILAEKDIEPMMRIQLCQLLVMVEVKDSRILSISMNALKESRTLEKYEYCILVQLFFNSYANKVELYENFNYDMKEMLKFISKKYTDNLYIKAENRQNSNKKIAIIVDQLMSLTHSTAKAAIDYAVNIKKYIEKSEIKIFVEDNFKQNIEESKLIYQYSSTISKNIFYEHEMYLKEHNSKDIEIYYSNTNMYKKDRVIELINEVVDFNPDIILNMNNAYSLSMEWLAKQFKSYYLTLGLVNWQENQIYNFYFEGVKEDLLPKVENNIILKTKAINFEKKERLYSRELFGFLKDDFIMVSVSLMPETDFTIEYIESMVEILNKNNKIKLLIVGAEKLEIISLKYKEMVSKKIFFRKYEQNLGALYQICDIYVNPPRVGGGYSIAEAMFYGLPIIYFQKSEAGECWGGIENGVKNNAEYIEKIERMYIDKKYFMMDSEKMKKKILSMSFKNHLEEIINNIGGTKYET